MRKMVYVEYSTEFADGGATLKEHPSDKELEKSRDQTLIQCSVAAESDAQGIVWAYFGVDKHWHFERYLTAAERKRERL